MEEKVIYIVMLPEQQGKEDIIVHLVIYKQKQLVAVGGEQDLMAMVH